MAWQVLTDHQEWSSPPLHLPTAPAAWYQLAAIGGWQAVIADTTHPVTHDVVTARCGGRGGATAAWCGLPYAVPVICAATTASGVQALQSALMAASADGLPLQRTVVVWASLGEGRLPAAVRAAETMLQPRVAAVVHVPYDAHLRSHGLRDLSRLKPRTLEAGHDLARAVLASAHAAWGEPLPPAAVPAALPAGPAQHPALSVPEKVSR